MLRLQEFTCNIGHAEIASHAASVTPAHHHCRGTLFTMLKCCSLCSAQCAGRRWCSAGKDARLVAELQTFARCDYCSQLDCTCQRERTSEQDHTTSDFKTSNEHRESAHLLLVHKLAILQHIEIAAPQNAPWLHLRLCDVHIEPAQHSALPYCVMHLLDAHA